MRVDQCVFFKSDRYFFFCVHSSCNYVTEVGRQKVMRFELKVVTQNGRTFVDVILL